MMKNYYLILGLDYDATQEEIRSAYRRLAKELHPDYYGQESEPFLALQEAYAVLIDPVRRRVFDRSFHRTRMQNVPESVRPEPLRSRQPQAEPLIPESESSLDLGELSLSHSFQTYSPSFDEIFDRLWRNFGPTRPKVEDLESLNVEIPITPLEAHRGGRVRIMIPARLRCPTCQGRGGVGFFECRHCAGEGIIEGEFPVLITFPSGIPNNHVVSIPLDRFGVHNFYLTVFFKVSEAI